MRGDPQNIRATRPLDSVRSRLLRMQVIATLVPTLLVGMWFVFNGWRGAESSAATQAAQQALHLSQQLELWLPRHVAAVHSLVAAVESLPEPLDPVLLKRLVSGSRARQPGLISMLIATPDGQVHAADPWKRPEPVSSQNIADRDYFKAIVGGGQEFISDVFQGRGNVDAPIVAISAPARDAEGRLRAVVQGALDLQQIRELFNKTAAGGLQVVLLDRNRQPIASSSTAPTADFTAWLAEPIDSVPQRKGALLFARLPTVNGWTLAVAQPLVFPDEGQITDIALALGVLVIALLLALAGARRAARRIVLPLEALQRYSRSFDLAALQGSEKAPYDPDAPAEIRALAAHLEDLRHRLRAAAERDEMARSSMEQVISGREAQISARTQELEARGRQLEMALAQSSAAGAAKDNFLATMSHELRTPLTSVVGFSERLLKHSQDDEQRRFAAIVHGAGRQMQALIDDLLDVARIESGRFSLIPSEFELAPLLNEVVAVHREMIEAKGLRFEVAAAAKLPRLLRGDPVRIEQVLHNLLGNATKFTDGGSVRLILSPEHAEGVLRVIVEDTGIGITEEKAKCLFQRFSQADQSINRRFGGTGLGLYVSREMAKRMGGDIRYSAIANGGSRFELVLPVSSSAFADSLGYEPGEMAQSGGLSAPLPRLRGHVLVAEDNAHNRSLVQLYLDEIGVSVVFAEDGEQALDRYNEQVFDLVLMDMHMPRMNGLEATRLLRLLAPRLPIIALTADLTPAGLRQQKEAGCNATLGKPIDVQALAAELARHLPSGDAADPGAASVTEPAPAMAAAKRAALAKLTELKQRFVEQIGASYIEPMADVIAASDWPEMVRLAHKLYGAAGSYGIEQVAAPARALERYCETGEVSASQIQGLFAELQREVAALRGS